MSDDPPNGSHQDRLDRLVLAVHRLLHAHEAEWHRQVSEFLREEAERRKAEDEASGLCQRAARAIAEERAAVQAGIAAPRLTDPDPKHRPGKGWEWRTGFTDDEDRDESEVEGWMSPEAVAAEDFLAAVENRRLYWLGPNPSLATMFVLLAIAHDQYLSDSRTILDPVTGQPLKAILSQDSDVHELMGLRMDFLGWQERSPRWQETLESYLVDIEAYLGRLALAVAQQEGCPRDLSGPDGNRNMPNNSDTAERAHEIALEVDGLYYKAPARWHDQWATARAQAEDWHARHQEAQRKKQDAEDAIWHEVRAVEAGKAECRLTDPDAHLGEGWTWQHVDIRDPADRRRVQTVQAWLPPGAAIAPEWWPRPAPSLAAQYLILAVFRDAVLPKGSARIMDARTAESRAVGCVEGWNFGEGGPHLRPAELWAQAQGDEFCLRLGEAGVDRVKTYLNAVRADLAARQVPALSHRPPEPPFLEGQDMTQPGSYKDARTLLNQAGAVESVAKALRTWGNLLNGMVIPPGGSEEARRPTRTLFTLIVRYAKLLRRLLNKFGCHEYIRPKITSMLDVASSAEMGEDVGGYWSRADDYAGEHLCGGPCSVPDELAKWVQRLRAEAATRPEPEDLATGRRAAGETGEGGGHGGGEPKVVPKAAMKEPCKEALAAYRLWFLQGSKQGAIAEVLSREFHRPISQGQVSKWLKEVKKYLEAGNILPPPKELHENPASFDPDVLEMGQRQDGRTKRQRPRRDDDDPGGAE